jgi:hypothetical protein
LRLLNRFRQLPSSNALDVYIGDSRGPAMRLRRYRRR